MNDNYRWKCRGTRYNDEDNIDHKKLSCTLCHVVPNMCLKCPKDSPWADNHDPCIGHIDGVKGVCCGHGDWYDAYISYENGFFLRGKDAVAYLDALTTSQVG